MGKRGISAIVATVMTVLITVAAVTIIWTAIIPMIQENIELSELNGRVSIVTTGGYTVYDANEKIAIVQVKRYVDDGVMERIKIIFSIGGSSVSSIVVAPNSGGTKTYTFDLLGYGEPDSVSVAPIFISGDKEKVGVVMNKVDIPKSDIVDAPVPAYDLGNDYSFEMPVTGLVSWWKFNGNFNDSVGDNDGDCANCPEFINGAVEFDGVDDVVIVADSENLQFTNGSWSFWMWVNETQATSIEDGHPHRFLAKGGGVIPYSGWSITVDANVNDGPIKSLLFAPSREEPIGCTPGVNCVCRGWCNAKYYNIVDDLNKWTHFVLTVDGTELKIYINGEHTDTDDLVYNLVPTTGVLSIGSTSSGSRPYTGKLDDIMMFNRILSEDEITAIFENQKKD